MRSGDVIDLIEAHARGDERKWLDTLEEMVKWEREKGNDVLADDMMRAMWEGRKDTGTATAKIARILTIMYDRGWPMWGRDAEIERLLDELTEEKE